MLKDRGSIKWTSLMLPEHVQMLKDLWDEDHIQPKPILDDQLLDELNRHLKNAIQQHKNVRLTVHLNGQQQVFIGKIKQKHGIGNSIILQTSNGNEQTIDIYSIIDLHINP